MLTAFTGDEYFPGGVYEWTVAPGDLKIEPGRAVPSLGHVLRRRQHLPSDMGIHIAPDDLEGRKIGSACGKGAWALARRYFDGTARA